MSKAEQIRQLASEGLSTAEIAHRMGIRYQHAYNVLKRSLPTALGRAKSKRHSAVQEKPELSEAILLEAGFEKVAFWRNSTDGRIELSTKLPATEGVYAFCIDGIAQYVGLASMGLAKRIYFYARPGMSQRTSIRLNGQIIDCLAKGQVVEVLIAKPSNLEWNGLPVHGCAGLEMGLIKAFSLPWNQRSAK